MESVGVQNIFDFSGTNIVTVVRTVTVTHRDGEEFRNRSVTVMRTIQGKATAVRDYYFDMDALREAWGKEGRQEKQSA